MVLCDVRADHFFVDNEVSHPVNMTADLSLLPSTYRSHHGMELRQKRKSCASSVPDIMPETPPHSRRRLATAVYQSVLPSQFDYHHHPSSAAGARCRARRVSAGVTASVAAAAAGNGRGKHFHQTHPAQPVMLNPQHLVRTLVHMGAHPCFVPVVQAYAQSHNQLSDPGLAAKLSADIEASLYSMQGGCTDPELDQFMALYRQVLENHRDKCARLQREAEEACSLLESSYLQLMEDDTIARAVADAGPWVHADEDVTQGSHSTEQDSRASSSQARSAEANDTANDYKTLSPEEEEAIIKDLKKRFAGPIVKLKIDFMKRQKKGKLPKEAKIALNNWWNQHILWPYPSEEDKNELRNCTGLNMTQINNWFINQRKRHWHKLFPGGPPNTPLEAQNGLKARFGSLQLAMSAVLGKKKWT